MPIIRIEALPALPPRLLAETAQAAAAALATEPERVWVTYRRLEEAHYYEGGRIRGAADAKVASPLVTLSLLAGRPEPALREALRAIAVAVGTGLGVDPDRVFVECREIPAGRAHSGGVIR